MAMVGITIGTSFMIALVAGPIVAGLAGVPGIFWGMAGLALLGIGIILFIVPSPQHISQHRAAETVPAMLGSVLSNKELLRLDFGIFALHAMLTASFLVVPELLHNQLNVTSHSQWIVYLPVLLISVLVMIPAIIAAEKYRRMKSVLVGAVGALAASQIMFVFSDRDVYVLLAAMTLFFVGFNIMEASLPSLITKTAPPDAKGTARRRFVRPSNGYVRCSIKVVLRRMPACFWKACLEMSNARPDGCARRRPAILVHGGSKRSWVAAIGTRMLCAISFATMSSSIWRMTTRCW